VNANKTKYMSRDHDAGRSHGIKIDDSSFEKVEDCKYLGTTLSKCSTYWGEEGCIQGFGGETLGKQTTWKTEA